MSDVAAAGFRTEHDSMGEVQVPADALWGAQTARAVENFPISGQPVPAGVVHALARLKAAAADVNAELGVLDPDAGPSHRRGRAGRSRTATTTTSSPSTSSRPGPARRRT